MAAIGDDIAIRPSSGARSSTYSQLAIWQSRRECCARSDLSDRMIYNWRRQDRIDGGLQPGVSTAENAESARPTADRRVASQARDQVTGDQALKDAPSPKIGTRPLK